MENYIFNHKQDLKSVIENNIWDLDVLKSIPHGEDEDRCHQRSWIPNIFCPMTLPWSWHSTNGEEWRVEALVISLWMVEDDSLQKVMETLTLKGYLLSSSTKLKWLKSTVDPQFCPFSTCL